MGVLGLWKLIDSSGKPVPLEMLENKILAVDISIWLHQVVKGFQDAKGNALPNAHLLGLFNRLCKLLYYRIKPVFVFDGGVPLLKRETIAKRYQSKNKYISEADRIQTLLLNSLAKEKIVQQALGVPSTVLISPSKTALKKAQTSTKAADHDEIFKLPEPKNEQNESNGDTSASMTETDSSFDEENEYNYYRNLKSIDVNSNNFKNLPADVRYELLSEMKETRKHSSWRTIHELPAESLEFCSFQMKRLIKRRQVQVSLEEAEKEIGGKSLSLDVLESLLIEDGIEIDPKLAVGGQIASDENTRFILVRDLKKHSEQNIKVKPEEINVEIKKEINDVKIEDRKEIEKFYDPGEGSSKFLETMQNEGTKGEVITLLEIDEDEDLQKAIQLSLMLPHNGDNESKLVEESDTVKLTEQQKAVLSKAAKSLARGFILENSGMTNEEFNELIEYDENDEVIDPTFKYNDSYVAYGKTSTQQTPTKTQKCDIKSISSDTDSDLVEVANDDFNSSDMNIFPVFPMNYEMHENTDSTKDFRISDLQMLKNLNNPETSVEVIVRPEELKNLGTEDDIFADIFVANPKVGKIISQDSDVIIVEEEVKSINDNKPNVSGITPQPLAANNVQNILEELKKQKLEINKIDLDDIKLDSIEFSNDTNKFNIEKLKSASLNSSKDNLHKLNDDGYDSDTTVIDENLHTVNDLNKLSSQNVIEIFDNKNVVIESSEPICINDSESIENDLQINAGLVNNKVEEEAINQKQLNNHSEVSPKTYKKQTEIQSFFKGEITPTKKKEVEENDPNIPSPYFVKRTPNSSGKKRKEIENNHEHSAAISKKSLLDEFENVKDLKNIDPNELMRQAAKTLKEKKTEEELNEMIVELSKEKKQLETERNKQDRFSASITEQMSRECMELLKLFGIPYIVAPMEAEAQCAFLNYINLTDGTITDDSDIWLFGGRTVYKNFFNQKKNVMEFRIENIEKLYNMDRKKMIQVAMLVGSDYTTGVNGIGAVTALEILAAFQSTPEKEGETNANMSILSGLRKFKNWFINGKQVGTSGKTSLKSKLKNIELSDGFPYLNVAEAYLYPKVDENRTPFSWGYPEATEIYAFTKKNFGWTRLKTDETLVPVLKKLDDRKLQQSIKNYFKIQSTPTTKTLKVSKRLKKAIDRMGEDYNSDNDSPKHKKTKKKVLKKAPDQIDVDDAIVVDPSQEIESGSVNIDQSKTKKQRNPKAKKLTTSQNDNQDEINKKSKQTRKRKIVEPDLNNLTESMETKPSTSSSSVLGKTPLISKTNQKSVDNATYQKLTKKLNKKETIPQREKEEQERQSTRLKAIEIFKKSKN